MRAIDRRVAKGEGAQRGRATALRLWPRNRMGGREVRRCVEELLNGFQGVLDELGCQGGCSKAAARRRRLTEEEWLLRDASLARIDGAVQVLELLGYAPTRGEDGLWRVGRR